MIRATPLLRIVGVMAMATALSGCVSLLPKTKPAHLYRFGEAKMADGATFPAAGSVGVLRIAGAFQREAAGDRLLTITGDNAAYIAQSRWVGPAAVLFDQAIVAAFDADPGPVRLVSRGQPGTAGYILRVDVRNFETRYDNGPETAPTVLVRVRAVLVNGPTVAKGQQGVVVEQMFQANVRANDNRVGEIVSAYDKAVGEVLGKTVAWTNSQVRAGS